MENEYTALEGQFIDTMDQITKINEYLDNQSPSNFNKVKKEAAMNGIQEYLNNAKNLVD